MPSAPQKMPAWAKSLLLHGLLLVLLLGIPALHMPEPVQPKAIQAVVINSQDRKPVSKPRPQPVVEPTPPAPEPLPEPEPEPEPPAQPKPPKPEPKPEKTAEPAPVKTPAKAKDGTLPPPAEKPKPEPKKAEPKRPAIDPKAVDAELEAINQQASQVRQQQLQAQRLAEQKRLQEEMAASIQASKARANEQIVNQYSLLIKNRTQSQWRRPLSAKQGMGVVLRISMIPGGEVTNVVIVKSSGDAAFDASATDAVWKASPLPVPADSELFNSTFRNLTFKFNPEDL